MRIDGRTPEQARPVSIQTDFVRTAAGSCLISTGNTRVICTASVEEGVPPFLKGKGQGWVTAEYAMLPASTGARKKRDGIKKDGRSVEIQRLIGRSLRQAIDLTKLGERTITLDCDVLEADGGTRTASITGAMVSLPLAVDKLLKEGKILQSPIVHQIAAVSVGVVDDVPCCDLCYTEDSSAQVDMNLVMNEQGEFIELQGTGEGRAFTGKELTALLKLGKNGVKQLMRAQRKALGEAADHLISKPVLVAATGNAHKLTELQHIFGEYYTVVSKYTAGFNAPIDEHETTFAGNAAIKAETVCQAVGLPTIADDSGLAVDALDGEPGVYSARYAEMSEEGRGDKDNNALLLRRMKGRKQRGCAFHCAIALAIPGEETRIAEGQCPGVLLEQERGEGGFGYDPLFLYEPLNKTFAEVTEEEKNAVSHRARACEKMLAIMKELNDSEDDA